MIDWDKMVEMNVRFAFIKCSEGESIKDDKFARNYKEAKARGIKVGAYHFVRMNANVRKQDANILQAVGDRELDFFALDCETTDGADRHQISATISNLAGMIGGINNSGTPFIYTSPGWWNSFRYGNDWDKYPLWVANWNVAKPWLPTHWKQWTVWQYQVLSEASAFGVKGSLDLNRWNPAVPFPGDEVAQPPEAMPEPETWTITIKGIEYNLVKKGD